MDNPKKAGHDCYIDRYGHPRISYVYLTLVGRLISGGYTVKGGADSGSITWIAGLSNNLTLFAGEWAKIVQSSAQIHTCTAIGPDPYMHCNRPRSIHALQSAQIHTCIDFFLSLSTLVHPTTSCWRSGRSWSFRRKGVPWPHRWRGGFKWVCFRREVAPGGGVADGTDRTMSGVAARTGRAMDSAFPRWWCWYKNTTRGRGIAGTGRAMKHEP
jgi:hypothetical protein